MYGIESIEMHNNVIYRQGSGSPQVMTEDNVSWSSGTQVIFGSNNWVKTGATNIPVQWTNTIQNSDPRFEDFSNNNLYPASDSPLKNAGLDSITNPQNYAFPNPLEKAIYQACTIQEFSQRIKTLRPIDECIDIGGYECGIQTGIIAKKEIPDYYLNQNYPNPFNPTTTINFTLFKENNVKIEIFNVLGQKIVTLLNTNLSAGSHEVEFTAANLSSGVYFYMIQAGEIQKIKKMILSK